jgi:hypothetical protein
MQWSTRGPPLAGVELPAPHPFPWVWEPDLVCFVGSEPIGSQVCVIFPPPATLVIVSSFVLAPPSARPPYHFRAGVLGPYLVFHLRRFVLLGYRVLLGLRCNLPGIGSLRRSVSVPRWAARPRWSAQGRVSSGSLTAALVPPPPSCASGLDK